MKKIPTIISYLFLLICISSCGLNKEKEVANVDSSDILTLSEQAIKANKLSIVKVNVKTLKVPLTSTGQLKLNEDAVFKVSSLISGRVVDDFVKLGDSVYRGQTLALIENPDIAKIQTNYIHDIHQSDIEILQAKTRLELANSTLAREKKLEEEGISPKKDLLQAISDATIAKSELQIKEHHKEHLLSEAKVLLKAYGLNFNNLSANEISTNTSITAVRPGIITKKNITIGAIVNPDLVLYEIADLSNLWLDINIYSGDISKIKKDQTINFKTDSYPDTIFIGKIDYIQPTSINNSGVYIARAFVDNSKSLLRPGMFGEVNIQQEEFSTKVFVPDECIQKYGKEYFVFEAIDKTHYKKHTVDVGSRIAGGHLINSGVENGMNLVREGSFLLKSELLKNTFAEEE